MKLSIILCIIIASVCQAITIVMPRFDYMDGVYTTTVSPPFRQKHPEERRRLIMYPRLSKKFIITPRIYRRYVTQIPTMQTRKPLMRKLVILDKNPNLFKREYSTKRPVLKVKYISMKPIKIKPASKANLRKETYDIHNTFKNYFYDGDFNIRGDYSENVATIMYPKDKANYKAQNVFKQTGVINETGDSEGKNVMFTPKIKETEFVKQENLFKDFAFTTKMKYLKGKTENTSSNINAHSQHKESNTGFLEQVDRDDFIGLDRNEKINKIIPESLKEKYPTKVIVESKYRRKRSKNVIEEENLGTTMSGLKFTVKNGDLISDLVFKNINS